MSGCSLENCQYECDNNSDKCILHCEKNDWYQVLYNEKDWSISNEKIKYFWEKIRKIISEASENEIINFKYIYFPKFEKVITTRSMKVLTKKFNFIESHANGLAQSFIPEFSINMIIDFSHSKFLDNVNFDNYKFKNFINFSNVDFQGECSFVNTEFSDAVFNDTKFYKKVEFKNGKIRLYSNDTGDFKNTIFYDDLSFANVIFGTEDNEKLLDIDFRGTEFKRVHFSSCIFHKGFRFYKDTKIDFLNIQSINLKELYIAGNITNIYLNGNSKGIDRLTIKHNNLKNLQIYNYTVKDDFLLVDKKYRKDDIFELDTLNLSESTFKGKVKIQFYNIREEAKFYNTKFEDLADFYQTKFYKVNFERADFKGIAVFSEAEFYCDVDFKYVKFLKQSIFRDMVITGKLNLRDTIFDADANFLDVTSINKNSEFVGDPKIIDVVNRETARIIKNFYDASNNIIEANKFYALEMKEREKELNKDIKSKKNIFEWMVFKVHSVTSNHSQDWFLPLLWILFISFSYISNIPESYFNSYILFIILSFEIIFLYINKILKYFLSIMLLIMYFTFDISLNCIANKINPFSIITDKETLTFGFLLFKITIAYLIYQFIVSIRQNTRRK